MRTLIVNNTHLINDGKNSKFEYFFPMPQNFKNEMIALASLSMYNSWYNISQANNNNQFKYTWIDGSEYTITMEDGNYEIVSINAYLQSVMVANKHFLENSNGDYVYYLEIKVNATTYKIEIVSYNVPTSTEASNLNYTQPTDANWSFPEEGGITNPSITILNDDNNAKFQNIIAFQAGTYPTDTTTDSIEAFSSNSGNAPQVSPISTISILCNLCKNDIASPNTILYAFAPSGTFGSQTGLSVPELVYTSLQDGNANKLTLTLTDQNYNPINIQDEQIVIVLSIKNKYFGTELEQK